MGKFKVGDIVYSTLEGSNFTDAEAIGIIHVIEDDKQHLILWEPSHSLKSSPSCDNDWYRQEEFLVKIGEL